MGSSPVIGAMTTPLSPWRHPRRLLAASAAIATSWLVAVVAAVSVFSIAGAAFGLLPVLPVAVPFVWLMFVVSRGFARLERHRLHSLLGERILDPVPPLTKRGWLGRLWERVRSRHRWKEIAFHAAKVVVAPVGFALASLAWCGSIGLLFLPLYVGWLPGEAAHFWLFDVEPGARAFALAGVGLVGLVLVAPWVTIGWSRLEQRLAEVLLGPNERELHQLEVSRLESSRTAAVDSAEAERRRIERDLHDGAQQRLVALAASLGAAREKLGHDDVAGSRQLVVEAHEEAKAALAEIRDLVRGIHPVILEDRGLDAALSAVVARSPVPVQLDVAGAERPPAAVESAAYFVVSEALTNVARHAAATRAHVSIARAGSRLVIEVRDDGRGGADPERGTGLRGLRDRVAGLGGTMYVISPIGGPTTISVELPCAS